MKEALLLADIQSDHFPGDKMEIGYRKEAVKKQLNSLKHSVF